MVDHMGPGPGERGVPKRRTATELWGELHPLGRLPLSGPPMEDVRTERNRDYPADTDFLYARGGTSFRTRLTPADVVAVIAVLAPSMPTPGELVAAFLASLAERTVPGGLPEADQQALERVIALLGEL